MLVASASVALIPEAEAGPKANVEVPYNCTFVYGPTAPREEIVACETLGRWKIKCSREKILPTRSITEAEEIRNRCFVASKRKRPPVFYLWHDASHTAKVQAFFDTQPEKPKASEFILVVSAASHRCNYKTQVSVDQKLVKSDIAEAMLAGKRAILDYRSDWPECNFAEERVFLSDIDAAAERAKALWQEHFSP